MTKIISGRTYGPNQETPELPVARDESLVQLFSTCALTGHFCVADSSPMNTTDSDDIKTKKVCEISC